MGLSLPSARSGRVSLIGICLWLSLLSPRLVQAQTNTRYVNTTGTNTNPAIATSWANSTTDLQGAINSLSATGGQVWVAGGVYKPGGNANTDRTISFQMRNNVAIYGGFMGNETTLNQRPLINLSTPSSTTLSGEIGNPNSTTDNSYHVISNPTGLTTGTPATATLLDGVVITGGNANGIFPNNLGGAMYNVNSSLNLTNCSFVNNAATTSGGAIVNFNSNPSLTNCILFGNGGPTPFLTSTAAPRQPVTAFSTRA